MVLPMRIVACLLAASFTFLQLAGNGSVCSRAQAMTSDCCPADCPLKSQGGNCCHLSDARASFRSTIPTIISGMTAAPPLQELWFFTTETVALCPSFHHRLR